MNQALTSSIQNYLKHIYELTEGGGSASTNALATDLGVRPASVTGMLRRLAAASPRLVEYQKHQGVRLTKDGRKAALEVIRHHRLIEAWLVKTLGYSWDEVHDEAERLEHAISENFERRIAAAMGNPDRDPHGEPIPTAKLKMPLHDALPLSELRPGQGGVVQSVKSGDTRMLRYLRELGLYPGRRIEIAEYSPFDQNLTVRLARHSHVLGPPITSRIYIERDA
jgi:DtxR family Mn-dependent transcriptional regulator